jgi:hypothetical protein
MLVCLLNRHRVLIVVVNGRKNSRTDKYRAITNEWNYDARCTVMSLLVWAWKMSVACLLLHTVVPPGLMQKWCRIHV